MTRKTLLLVDDSRTVLMQEQVVLRRNYTLLTAHDGREGLALAIAQRPDLVLMDVVMPEMDGLTACREMRKDARTRDIPIILVTTRGEHASRAAGFESGCTEYLTKPINAVDLLARIGACLDAPPAPNVRPVDAARGRLLRDYQLLGSGAEEDFDRLARLAARACGTAMAAITVVDRDQVWLRAWVGEASERSFPRAGSPCARVVEGSAPFTVADATGDPALAPHPFVRAHGIRFYAGVPIVPPGGIPVGALSVFDRSARSLSGPEAESLATIAGQVVAQLEIRRQCIRDEATGTFNRRYMEETLERELRRADRLETPLGLVLLQLTGVPAAGEAWPEIGALLLGKTRLDDVVCRHSESGFVVILPSASRDSSLRRAEQLRQTLEDVLPQLCPTGAARPRVSTAVATYPDDGGDGDALVRALTARAGVP